MTKPVWSWLRNESFRLGIAHSSVLNLIAKGLTFGVNVLIAYLYGTEDKANVFFYCFTTTVLLAQFVRGVNAAVLIPESIRLAEQESPKAAMGFVNVFLYLLLAICGCTAAAMLFDPVRVFSAISKFEWDTLESQRALLLASIPLFLLMSIAFFLTDVLVSHRFFTLPMLLSACNSIIVIVTVLCCHRFLDISSVLLGLLGGFTIQCGLLVLLMKHMLGWRFRLLNFRIQGKVWRDLAFSQLGNATTTFASYVPILVLSGYGNGLIAALSYARRVAELPTNLTAPFFSAAGIKLAQLYSRQQWQELNRIFQSGIRFLIFVLMPASALLFVFHHEVVSILFRRGNFDEASVVFSASLLRYLGLLVPLIAMNTMIARVFMAGRKIAISVWVQVLFNAAMAGAVVLALHRFGYMGYPYARVIVFVIHIVLVCFFLLRIFFPMLRYHAALGYLGLVFLLNGGLCGLLLFLAPRLPGNDILRVILGTALYGGLIVGLNQVFGINRDVATMVQRCISEGPRKALLKERGFPSR
jgi:peptidoglycan biosynthesis protein MviN/MurJ (putative lipid II flippase)